MIREATLADLVYVAAHARERDRQSITAFRYDDDLQAWAAERYGKGLAYVLMGRDGFPVAVGGVMMPRPGVGYAWLAATEEFPKYRFEMMRAARKGIRGWLGQPDVHRLEAACLAGFERAAELLRRLGFESEGLDRAAGKRREDIQRWAIVKGA